MSATMLIPRFNPGEVVPSVFTGGHEAWMAEASELLEPLVQSDATFWERWGAMNYLSDQLPQRLTREQERLRALEPSLSLELRNQVWNQANRVMRLHSELHELGNQRAAATDLARTTRKLLEALRLWFAEIDRASRGR